MKFSPICWGIVALFLAIAFQVSYATNDSDSDASKIERTTWDLLRDIRAKRPISRLYGQESWVAITSDYVQFQAPDRNEGIKADFAIAYPLPRGKKTVTIDMELRWPISEGAFQILFDSTSPSLFSGTGIAFSYENISNECRSGTTVGRLHTLWSRTEEKDYETAPMLLGSTWHSLQIVVKNGSISCTVDGSKSVSWTGKFTPQFILLSGDQFWFIDVRKFNMRVEMD